jgi:hypothetical protein
LPLELLQKVFVESYDMKKYYPTIMQPANFDFEQNSLPIYYSLQNPSTLVFSPKSRRASSTSFEMRELEHIMRVFIEELAKDNGICSDTIIHKIAKGVLFHYFHNKIDRHRIVRSSVKIAEMDERFYLIHPKYKLAEAVFASDAPFVRGCIRIGSS